MQIWDVDGLIFEFPDDWRVSKYDDWQFKVNFGQIKDHIKAVDLVAIDPQNTGWLIEGKDYRQHQRQKPETPPDEMIGKVFDTCAGLFAARLGALDEDEKNVAEAFCRVQKYRVVLHFAQPTHNSRLFPRVYNLANIQQKLRQKLKPIDPHSLVLDVGAGRGWSVR